MAWSHRVVRVGRRTGARVRRTSRRTLEHKVHSGRRCCWRDWSGYNSLGGFSRWDVTRLGRLVLSLVVSLRALRVEYRRDVLPTARRDRPGQVANIYSAEEISLARRQL